MATILKLLMIFPLIVNVIALSNEFIRETNNVLVPSNDINMNEKAKQINNEKTVDQNDLLMNDNDVFALGEILPKDKYMKMLQNYKNINHKLNDSQNKNGNNDMDQNQTIDKSPLKYGPEITTPTSNSGQNTTTSIISVESTTSKEEHEPLDSSEEDQELPDIHQKECVLKPASFYLKWVADNGTLIVQNIDVAEKLFVDHSYKFKNQTQFDDYVAELNSFENINRDKFKNLKILSLAFNNLISLPNKLLQISWNTLEYLSLTGNNFNTSDVNRKNAPRIIGGFPYLINLSELDMRNCKIIEIKQELFEKLINLRALFLSQNNIIEIAPQAFWRLRKLKHLDFSYNNKKKIAPSSSNEDKQPNEPFVEIFLGLKLKIDQFKYLKKLEHIDFSHTRIEPKSLVALDSLQPNLTHLSICYSDLPVVTESIFNNLANLEVLDISGNPRIAEVLSEKVFESFSHSLKVLFIQNGNIKSMEWSKCLKNLRVLSLKENSITSLNSSAIHEMEKLEILDLELNYIGNWYDRIFHPQRKLKLLNLRSNKINTLTLDMKNDLINVEVIGLGKNEFECSCILHKFFEEILTNTQAANEKSNSTGVFLNPSPSPTNDTWDMKNFQFYLDTMHSQLYEYDVQKSIFLKYFKLIRQSSETLSKQNFTRSHEPSSVDSDGKRYDPFQHRIFKEGLTEKNISTVMFDYSDDDYQCIENQKNKTLIKDALDQCDNLRSEDEEQKNMINEIEGNTSTVEVVVIPSIAVIVLIGLAIFIYWKWWYLKYFLIILKNSTILSFMMDDKELLKKKETDEGHCEGGFIYDVFVSYCDENREWVLNYLLPNIEKREEINVCLHERDFQVGYSILENIISCMDRSRVLLLVVSESFLLSQWCQFEMHLAQHRLLETRRDKLILVLLEDISNRKQSKTLKYLMKTKTYIKWPATEDIDQQKLFWKRLKRAIISSNWDNDPVTYGAIEK